jgi:phosphoribosylaminoimidazole-succinocarboxamide synthase
MELIHRGKVRDVYADGPDELVLVATDRVSVYDVVLPTPVVDKGKILTQLSRWWFEVLSDIVDNHVISYDDVPEEFVGRAVRVQRVDIIQVECIARGYLAGLGLESYQATGSISGVQLPAGLVEADKLPEPVFTPSTKAEIGDHDENIDFDAAVNLVGRDTAEQARQIALDAYQAGADWARERGIIIADTKFEFGLNDAGELVLIDEVLTADSSRFWPKDSYQVGISPPSYDKQFVRDYLETLEWNKEPPAPKLPADVIARTSEKYREALQRLTGRTLA